MGFYLTGIDGSDGALKVEGARGSYASKRPLVGASQPVRSMAAEPELLGWQEVASFETGATAVERQQYLGGMHNATIADSHRVMEHTTLLYNALGRLG